MRKKLLMLCSGVAILTLSAGLTFAVEEKPAQSEAKPGAAAKTDSQQERVRGSQFVTDQERADFREKMRAAKTPEERQQIRKEHHEMMKLAPKSVA